MRQAAATPLSTLVYRSRAVKDLSPFELHELTATSQARNGRMSVTGLMLYDHERFFQWLEGPPDSVDQIMGSIRADRRHTDVEVLDTRPARTRAFGDWSMKLATPNPVMASWRREVIEPPPEIVDGLRTRPEAAPSLLIQLGPSSGGADGAKAADDVSDLPLDRRAASILKTVFLRSVVPQLTGSGGLPSTCDAPAVDRRAAELADLLVSTDQTAAAALLAELRASGGTIGPMSAALFEPAARRLGDLWGEDFCSEFDVTVALCRLQTAARLLESGNPLRSIAGGRAQPVVLIVPEPGELHRLGAALDGTVLRNAGWSPRCEYPSDGPALDDLLSANWFDVLDLSLSTAFRREHTLPQVAKTIERARHASRNPALVVVVGGRVFVEEGGAGASVGADHASITACGVNRTILQTMIASTTAEPVSTAQVSAA